MTERSISLPPRILEVVNATKRIPAGGWTAFGGLVLLLNGGERLAVLGDSGAGRTLLLQAVAGIVPLDEGRVRVRHGAGMVDPARAPETVAYVSLGCTFYPFLTIHEVIVLARKLVRGWDAPLESELVRGFKIIGDRSCGALSPGECVMLQLILALCRGSSLILIDDGLSVLHPESVEFFFKVIKRPRFRETGLVFATQNFGHVSGFATATLTLHGTAGIDRMEAIRRG